MFFNVMGADMTRLVPIVRRLMSDTLTPVLAYRRLVRPDARLAPSFLLESVVGGDRVGRYSYLGSRPVVEVIAFGHEVTLIEHDRDRRQTWTSDDPLAEMADIRSDYVLEHIPGLPEFTGGWVGYAGYDTVRYVEPDKVPFDHAPPDDRGLPDLHFQLYHDVVAFDHVQKTIVVVTHAAIGVDDDADEAYAAAAERLNDVVRRLSSADKAATGGRAPDKAAIGGRASSTPAAERDQRSRLYGERDQRSRLDELPLADVDLSTPPPPLPVSSLGEGGYERAVEVSKRYIAAGDAFQIVPSQRFELRTRVDPFDIYRSLRVVNPSPYMFYLQARGAMLIGSSPEILCKVESGESGGRTVISRPLAGTRHRGSTPREDAALEADLRGDPKDTAEHVMLVDLHRNDVGRVAVPGSIALPELLTVERYSHVMHLSSEVRGELREGVTPWEALRVSLPVGTVSGAPKVRAMQIIDELEATRRGPYAGAVGYVDLAGQMDMAIALRTMVVMPTGPSEPGRPGPGPSEPGRPGPGSARAEWLVHIQAGGGIVADSDPAAEHQETVNKAAALAKAVAVAEEAFPV